jgi:hypothetical protein
MSQLKDDLRPKGTVELECPRCHWCSWFKPLHPAVTEAANGTYLCDQCRGIPEPEFNLKAEPVQPEPGA